MLKTIKKNILKIEHGIIVQQVNTLGIMGAGLAKDIKRLYPALYKGYRARCLGEGLRLGDVYYWDERCEEGRDLIFANIACQKTIGRTGVHTNYNAWDNALDDIVSFKDSSLYDGIPIYFPYLCGCGLAGGDWKIISSKIEKYLPDAIICQL